MERKNIRFLCFLVVLIVMIVSACSPASTSNVEPTAVPYNQEFEVESEQVASQSLVPQGEATGDPAEGEVVFEQYCMECHATQDTTIIYGPSLHQAGDRFQYGYIKLSIENPHDITLFDRGDAMPENIAENLSDDDVENVIAYVLSQKGE